jgi:hypothetical protein
MQKKPTPPERIQVVCTISRFPDTRRFNLQIATRQDNGQLRVRSTDAASPTAFAARFLWDYATLTAHWLKALCEDRWGAELEHDVVEPDELWTHLGQSRAQLQPPNSR